MCVVSVVSVVSLTSPLRLPYVSSFLRYDPTYYQEQQNADFRYEVKLDLTNNALGVIIAPMIQQDEKAVVIKAFSRKADGLPGK